MSLILLEGYPSTRGLVLFYPGVNGFLSCSALPHASRLLDQAELAWLRPSRPGQPAWVAPWYGIIVGIAVEPSPAVRMCKGVGV